MGIHNMNERNKRLTIRLERKWQDAWIGAHWNRDISWLDIWVCLIPFFPIHVTYYWHKRGHRHGWIIKQERTNLEAIQLRWEKEGYQTAFIKMGDITPAKPTPEDMVEAREKFGGCASGWGWQLYMLHQY